MRSIDGLGNWVLAIMAVSSFISIFAILNLNNIVNRDLYSYGLQFNYGWAIPYWNTIATVFVMSLVSIIAAVAFQIYRIRAMRRDEAQDADKL
jgi:hypothetical protein